MRWRPGDRWAVVSGSAGAAAGAFEVGINDYRRRDAERFYASPQQPAVPEALRGEVAGLGRILGYTPHREANRWMLPLEVPDQGLTPSTLLRTYNVTPLHEAGFTGKGATVVVFAFDGFDARPGAVRLWAFAGSLVQGPWAMQLVDEDELAPR